MGAECHVRTGPSRAPIARSADLTAEAVAAIAPADRAIRFLASGGDLIVLGRLAPAIAMAKELAALAATSPAFAKTIDAAVRRVLRAKAAAGLVDCGN